MKSFVLAVVLAAFGIALVSSQTCDSTQGSGTFNPACTNKKLPYCVNTDPSVVVDPPYNCVECISACDCSIGKYCSSAPGQIGKCVDFKREGKSCRPLTNAQLSDPAYPLEWKCADTYTVTGSNATIPDQTGVCIGGKCHQCDWDGNSNFGMDECGVDSGKGVERVCIYPGVLHERHSAIWDSKVYYGFPIAVWNAIFFPFLMIIIGVQAAILILQCMRFRKGGSGGSKHDGNSIGMDKHDSKHDSSKHDSKRDTADQKHSTITPQGTSTPPSYDEAASNNGGSRPGSTQIQYLKEEST